MTKMLSEAISLASTSTPRISLSVNYSFSTLLPSYFPANFDPYLTIGQKNGLQNNITDSSIYTNSVLDAFNQIGSVINITISQSSPTIGNPNDIDISYISERYVSGLNGYTQTSTFNGSPLYQSNVFSDIFFLDSPVGAGPAQPSRNEVILHETLHAFGFGNAWEFSKITNHNLGLFNTTTLRDPDDRYAVASNKTGIPGAPAEHLGMVDIYALQSLYPTAINFGFNSGNTTYTVLKDTPFTIWDGGGIDTITAANQSSSSIIDLRQGLLSDINSDDGYQYNLGIAFGTVIENAFGSNQDDHIIGNIASNDLSGGAGNDRIYGDGQAWIDNRTNTSGLLMTETDSDPEEWIYASHNGSDPRNSQADTLHGGDGDDKLFGGVGTNTLFGDPGDDELWGGTKDDELYGGSGDDLLVGGAGADTLDGGLGADIIVVDGMDTIAKGEVEDNLYYKTYTALLPSYLNPTHMTGGYRTVIVDSLLSPAAQALALRNSTTPFVGRLGEQYRVTTVGSSQSLAITMKSGDVIQIPDWHEGEYGIILETTKKGVHDWFSTDYGIAGFVAGAIGAIGTVITTIVNGVEWAINQLIDNNWANYAGDRFSLSMLDSFVATPSLPPRSNNIEGTAAGEAIDGRTTDDRILGFGGNDNLSGYLGDDFLSGGDGDDILDAGYGSDRLDGGNGDDTLISGAGSDTIITGAGNDIVKFAQGDGADYVYADANDTILIDAAISAAQTQFRTGASVGSNPNYGDVSAANTILSVGSDSLTFDKGAFGSIQFADGTVKTAAAITRAAIAGSVTAGNDAVLGGAGADTLTGGAGNDYLNGFGGHDRYVFARGNGQDRIEDPDQNLSDSISDTLIFANGIAPTDIVVSTSVVATGSRAGAPLVRLAISGSSDWVEFPIADIEQVRFQDGTVWSRSDIGSRALQSLATSGNDTITAVNDSLSGTFRPGAGNDVIKAGAYGASINFGLGSGTDRIELANSGSRFGQARVTFDASVGIGDLRFTRLADGIAATISGTTDRVEVSRSYDASVQPNVRDLDVIFTIANEPYLVLAPLLSKLADLESYAAQNLVGTTGNDTLSGGTSGDRISGGAGTDTINGNDGADLLFGGAGNDIITGGNGRDVLFGETGNDQLDGGADDDELFAGSGQDVLLGSAGNDILHGSGATTLTGGTGADTITTVLGDTIQFNVGDGLDVVQLGSNYLANPFDSSTVLKRTQIVLGAGITPAATTLSLNGWAIVIKVNGSATDQIRLNRLFQSGTLPSIRFADNTVWTEQQIYDRIFTPNNADDTPTPIVTQDPEYGSNTIAYVYGGRGNDILKGTNATENHYVFAPGDGNDVIDDYHGGSLELLGFDPDALRIARTGAAQQDFVLSFVGSTDTVTIKNQQVADGTSLISDVYLNGARLINSDLRTLSIAQSTTAGNDTIYGFDGPGGYYNGGLYAPSFIQRPGNDTVQGGLGNDLMIGGTGDDTYIVNPGDGVDIVRDLGLFDLNANGGNDVLRLGANSANVLFSRSTTNTNDLVVKFNNSTDQITINEFYGKGRIEEIEFVDGVVLVADDIEQRAILGSVTVGNDVVTGSTNPDTLQGGLGNDTLDGLAGADRYLFNIGDGNDTISDGGTGESNTLTLGAGISFASLGFSRIGNDLRIGINGSDSVTVTGQLAGALSPPLGQIVFADGSRKSWAEISQTLLDQAATSGNDSISGFASNDGLTGAAGNDILSGGGGNDVLNGGLGNDTLDGQLGTDTYVIARGDGVDQIVSTGDAIASDTVSFDATIGSRDVEFVRPTPSSPDLIINVRGTSQSITVSNYFSGTAVAKFAFADGTVFTSADITAALANTAPTATTQTWRVEAGEGGSARIGIPSGLFDDGADTASLTYRAVLADGSPLPNWLAFNGRTFQSDANDADVGTWAIRLTAIDRFGASIDRTIKFDVVNLNEAPVAASSLSTQIAAIGSAFSFALPGSLFSDQDTYFSTTSAPVAGTYATDHGGTLAVLADGSYTYTPVGGYVGNDSAQVPFGVGTGLALERPFGVVSAGAALTGTLPANLAPIKDMLTVSARLANGNALPAWLSFNGSTLSGTPAAGDSGPLVIEIVATDATGLAKVVPLNLKVGSTNAAPTATSLGTLHTAQNSPFYFAVPLGTFADSDTNDRLALSATQANGSPLPSWLTFDGYALSGIPANGDVTSLSLKVTATDIFGATVVAPLTLIVDNVNDSPVVATPISDQLATQGQAFNFVVPGGSFADPDAGSTLAITATQNTGDALPTWLTFASGTFSGTPTNADTGLYRIRVTATDAGGLSTFQNFTLGVVDVNDAPTVTQSLTPLAAPVFGQTVFTIPSGLFADADDPGYRLSVTLADGSPLPSWISFDPNFETITFVPGSSELFGKDAAAALTNVKITATDTRGANVSAILAATVAVPTVTSTITGTGSNTIFGTGASERIDAGSGNNTIYSGAGVDRIVFGRGSGQDNLNRRIDTTQYPLGDIVEFGANVLPSDLTYTRLNAFNGTTNPGSDLRIKINGTTDQLTINGQFLGLASEEPTVRELRFADGTVITAAQLLAPYLVSTTGNDIVRGSHQPDILNGGGGNDTIYGVDGDDTIDGGAGNDILYGEDASNTGRTGNDVFLFGRGSGNDTIAADAFGDVTSANNILRFGANVAPTDLIVTHLPGAADVADTNRPLFDAGSLLIQISGTSDSVKIDRQFGLTQLSQSVVNTIGIDRFEFADGTVMHRSQFESLMTLAPTTIGDDQIYGGGGNDRLQGGLGNDFLVGEDGNDTYVYNAGDGNDTIRETNQIVAVASAPVAGDVISFDNLTLGAGITPDEIVFSKPDARGEDLVISFKNHVGSISIEGQFRNLFHGGDSFGPNNVTSYFGTENAAIDEIRFADGTLWSLADIYAYSVRSTPGNDVIDGFFRSSETLDGGAGNDLLVGRNGDDNYVFARGYGNDVIKEFGYFYNDNASGANRKYTAADTIRFVGVASSEVSTSIGANGAFVFTINNTGETLTIKGESEFNNFTAIQFSDTTWDQGAFQARWIVAAATAGNDTINGFVANDTISGGAGNDILDGNQGVDILNGDAGDDILTVEYDDGDTANGGDNNDTFYVSRGVRYNGTPPFELRGRIDYPSSVAYGSEYATLDGGLGQDILILGGKFADYWNGAGYLTDNGNGSYSFKASMRISNIEQIRFADGQVSLTSLATATTQFRAGTLEGTTGNDVLNGTAGNDALYGLAGNDTINGLGGDDYLIGGAGTDTYDGGSGIDIVDYSAEIAAWTINLATGQATQGATTETFVNVEGAYGSSVADTITGSGNADIIGGYGGDDTIDAGAGNDFIEFADALGGFDAVTGGSGTDTLRATATNAVIGLRSITGVEAITSNGFSGVSILGSGNADTLDFTSITLTGIIKIDGGAGADTLTGSALADTIVGGAGDDILIGGTGDDIFQVSGTGAGFDNVSGGIGNDTIQALANNSTIGLSALSGVEAITANAFTGVSIAGSAIADTLDFSAVTLTGITKIDGGAGNDIITGSAGDDVILGSGGDDTLNGSGGNDTFQYTGSNNGFDAVDGGAGTDTISALANNTVIGLSSVANVETISAGAFTGVSIAGSANNDTLNFAAMTLTGITKIDGGAGNDSITGSAGADTVLGSAGDDTIGAGGGNDTIQYTGTSNGFDAVDGGAGTDTISALANSTVIGLSSLTGVEAVSAGSFTGVSIAGSGNNDVLDFSTATLTGITKIDGGAGNDTIIGSAGNDTILGSAGDDILSGGAGTDTFQYTGTTNGFDAVDGGSGTDTISALANATVIGLTSVTGIEAVSAGSFTGVSISGSASNDTLDFSAATLTAITKIDGGTGNDVIIGSAGNDTILGSAGDDTLNGGAGTDTIQYTGTTNGFDAVDGGAGTDTISALANSTVIGLSALTGVETISAGSFTGVYIAGSALADTLNFSAVTLTNIVRVEGGDGNDIITGNTAVNTLWGGLGNDTIDGGAGNDILVGDGGDDILIGGAGNDSIDGAAGIDTVDYSAATVNLTVNLATTTSQTVATGESDTITNVENVTGGSGADTLTGSTLNNNIKGGSGADRMTGGVGNDSIDGGLGTDVAVFAGLQASYTISTVNGTTTITDNQPSTDGNDGVDTLIATEKAEFKGGVQVGLAVPIVLDLNGDGVTLVDPELSKAQFDWDGDGARDETGWVGKDDGILVYDRNGDGKVSGADELSFVNDKPGAKSDLDGLSAFDSNGDGLFSDKDAKWGSFRVWKDTNGNGKQDKHELVSLAQAGVASITLAGQAVNKSWSWEENITVNTGTFTRTNGQTAALGDVGLRYTAKNLTLPPVNVETSLFGGKMFAGFDFSALLDSNSGLGSYQRQGVIAREAVVDSSTLSAQTSAAQLAEAIAGFGVGDGGLFTAANDQLTQRYEHNFVASRGAAL